MKCNVSAHCDHEVGPRSRTGACHSCLAAFRYAQREDKGPEWVTVRHRQLLKFTDRIIQLSKKVDSFKKPVAFARREFKKY